MNTLDLPPRRSLPDETRERLRRAVHTGLGTPRSRSRAPIAAAAAVALLAAASVGLVRWSPEDAPPAAPPHPDAPVTMTLPDAGTAKDLDHCGDVVEASGRVDRFTPRSTWRPEFTATAPDGARITAFRTTAGKPAFCEVTATTATVTDPTADGVPLGIVEVGLGPTAVFTAYLSPTGVLAGYAVGMDALEFSRVRDGDIVAVGAPAFRDGQFVVNLGDFPIGKLVDIVGRDSQGKAVFRGTIVNTPVFMTHPVVAGAIG